MKQVTTILFIALALAAFDSSAQPLERLSRPTSLPPNARLRAAPLDLEAIRSITPLGNLNPRGGHVFPTDHIYFDYGRKAGLPVYALAEGLVQAIRGQSGGDFKIEVKVDNRLTYYVAHLFVEDRIKSGSAVDAGQVLGTTSGSGALDLGCVDVGVSLKGFVNPRRYPASTLHAVPPLQYYDEPLRRRLYSKVERSHTDPDGRIDLDVPDRLAGNWFLEGLSEADSARGTPATWTQQLAFVPDVRRPGRTLISIGGTLAPAGVYAASDDAPDPAQVSTASGKVAFRFRRAGDGQGKMSLLLVQMLAGNRVQAQYFPDTIDTDPAFGAEAMTYER